MLTTKHYVSIDSIWVFKSQQFVEESSVYLLFEPVFFYLYVVIIDKSKQIICRLFIVVFRSI